MTTDDAYDVTWLIRRLFRAMAEASNKKLQDFGISAADRAVLEFLYPDEMLSVPDIAARYDVSRQHVQVTVNRLLAAELVKTTANPRHKRSPLIALTRKGSTLFSKVLARDRKLIDDLFRDIAPSNLKITQRTLRQLQAHLRQEETQ